jgi:glycosyltransferase involved in cell wall biosynthesis
MKDKILVVAFPHPPSSIGGPGSFQSRLENRLLSDGHKVIYAKHKNKIKPDVILIVGGTGKIFWLLVQKLRGIRIVHRLDGKNWQQSISKDGLSIGVKSRLVNWMIWGIKFFLADAVIYQSKFVAKVWRENIFSYSNIKNDQHIIYNSVSISDFYPTRKIPAKNIEFKMLCIEGTINGAPAITILRSINDVEVNIYGEVSKEVLKSFDEIPKRNIVFKGIVDRSKVPDKLAGLKIFLNLETNPPCPNAVIEAMASGVPIVGFDSGSLKELVGDAGIVLPYGAGNPWSLTPPDCTLLDEAIKDIICNYDNYSSAARRRAERIFSLDTMYDKYCKVLFK